MKTLTAILLAGSLGLTSCNTNCIIRDETPIGVFLKAAQEKRVSAGHYIYNPETKSYYWKMSDLTDEEKSRIISEEGKSLYTKSE